MLQFASVAPGGRTKKNAWKSQGDKFDSMRGRIFSQWGLFSSERGCLLSCCISLVLRVHMLSQGLRDIGQGSYLEATNN